MYVYMNYVYMVYCYRATTRVCRRDELSAVGPCTIYQIIIIITIIVLLIIWRCKYIHIFGRITVIARGCNDNKLK